MADTVIVGAGSAGAVIAARMTERTHHDVLLVEAGPDYPDPRGMPKDLLDGTRNSMRVHDWGYRHRPVPKQLNFEFPRGRVVGGSSAVNTCIALRGQPYDYDEWASRGLAEWSFDRCLPAFKRLEHDLDFDNEWHGTTGPVPIRRHTKDELVPWQGAFVDAADRCGFSPCADTNDPTTTGYGPHAMNKVHGERMSAARCYLTPAVRKRPNLQLRPGTAVHRVIIKNRRVQGLTLETNGRVYDILAERVILSAGAIATPGILLRSGVGPRRTLERIGVDVVSDVPAVGAQLFDHPGLAVFFRPKRGVCSTKDPLIQNVLRYTSEGSDCPNDMQLQPGSFVPLPFGIVVPWVIVACCVGKPRGHGTIEFTDANPRTPPRIDSLFLEDAADRARAAEAMRLAWRLSQTESMKKMGTPFWPGEKVLTGKRLLDAYLWRICGSGYHPCGTVPMGPDTDPKAAVSGRGRVRGIEGLWVADASIMPTIPSSNTNLATLMIGERFGEWFREGSA